MRKMKDSGIAWIGEIPAEWVCCKQKYVIQLLNGRAYKDSEFEAGGKYKVLRVGNLFTNPVWYTSSLELDDDKYCEHGDLLYAWSMSYAPIIWTGEKVIYHYHIWKVVLSQILNIRFAFYYLMALTNALKAEVHEITMGFITMGIMNNSYITYPICKEQETIAAFLDEKCAHIDAVIEKTRASIDEYKKLKQAVITRAVTKGIRQGRKMKDSGIEWIGEIPQEWKMATMGRCILFEGGSQPPLTQFIHEPAEGYVRLIQNRDYKTDAYITYVPKDSVSKFCDEDDIMIGRYGPPIFVLHRGIKGAYNVALMKAIPQDIDKEWMVYVLQEYTLLKYIESFSKRAAGQDGVNPKSLKNYPLPVPPLPEQQEIASYLDAKTAAIDRLIAKKEQLVAEMESCKKSLIYEYVTGKKEVQN